MSRRQWQRDHYKKFKMNRPSKSGGTKRAAAHKKTRREDKPEAKIKNNVAAVIVAIDEVERAREANRSLAEARLRKRVTPPGKLLAMRLLLGDEGAGGEEVRTD